VQQHKRLSVYGAHHRRVSALRIFDRIQAVIYAVREGVIEVGDLEYRPPREPSP
jgi:hypothetical protein